MLAPAVAIELTTQSIRVNQPTATARTGSQFVGRRPTVSFCVGLMIAG